MSAQIAHPPAGRVTCAPHGMPLPMVIVHRGGEANAPENTLAAFTHTAPAAAESAVAAAKKKSGGVFFADVIFACKGFPV